MSVEELEDESLLWPRFDSRVWLAIGCCPSTGHTVRSAGLAGENFLLTRPMHEDDDRPATPEPGDTLMMGWGGPNGYLQREAAFVAVREGESETWELEAAGTIEKIERRRFVRVSCAQPAQMTLPGKPSLDAMVVDMGEDGLRCAIPGDVSAPETGELQVSFALRENVLCFSAAVAWWGEQKDDRRQVGLKFMSVREAIADQLRQHIFGLQLEERRRQRDLEG